jgi:hypothetical protein
MCTYKESDELIASDKMCMINLTTKIKAICMPSNALLGYGLVQSNLNIWAIICKAPYLLPLDSLEECLCRMHAF